MKKTYNIILSGLLSLSCLMVFAQKDSTLQQSMIVERDFSPIVRDANKIDQQPQQEEIKVKKSATRYADWMAPTASSSEVGVISAGQVVATDDPYKNGFVELSAGNYFNADLKAGIFYKDFFAQLNGFATKGDIDLPYEPFFPDDPNTSKKWESRMLNGDFKLGIDHIFVNSSRVRAYIGASGRNYNMLNVGYVASEKHHPIGYTGNEELLYFNNSSEKLKQKTGRIGASVNFDINDFSLNLTYNHDAEKFFDSSENSFNIGGRYGWYYDETHNLTVGLNLGMQFAEDNYFTFRPEIEYSRFGSSALSRFYVNVKAGVSRLGLYDLLNVMPMAFNLLDYETEANIFDATLGYENNDNGSLHYGAFIGASLTTDRMDAEMLAAYDEEELGTDFFNKPGDKSGPATFAQLVKDDAFEFKAGAYLDYEYSKFFKTKAGVKFNSNPRFGNEKLNVNLHFLSNPTSKLSLDLGFDGGLGREMIYTTYDIELSYTKLTKHETEVDLKNILDLNFRADYQLKNNLNIFIYGKNLCNVEYQHWAGVPAQKINIHAGFNWIF